MEHRQQNSATGIRAFRAPERSLYLCDMGTVPSCSGSAQCSGAVGMRPVFYWQCIIEGASGRFDFVFILNVIIKLNTEIFRDIYFGCFRAALVARAAHMLRVAHVQSQAARPADPTRNSSLKPVKSLH